MSRSDLKNWPILSLLEPEFIAELKMVMVYGNLGNEALLVLKDGTVHAVGNNATGCLGTGDAHSTLYPKKIDVLSSKGIKAFAYGIGPHVLALTDKGEVNVYGPEVFFLYLRLFAAIETLGFQNFFKGNRGEKHHSPLDSVYSWGHNGFCELGNGSSNQVSTPTKIESNLADKVVVEIACGSHHSLALTEEGEVYAWGQNTSGQVGSGMCTNQNTPRKVNSNLAGKKVVNIACGQSSSMAVTSYGEVYGWGNDSVGQLGTGKYVNQPSPHKVVGLSGIVVEKVVCGYSHTLALSDEGDLYVWGGNAYGQLGLGTKINSCSPVKLNVPEMGRVSDVAAVHYNHISVAVGHDGQVFMWGQCRGQSVPTPTPTPFTNLHEALASYATPSVMHTSLKLYSEEETSILDCLKQAFDDPSSSDLTIQVQGKPIHVHKAVLKIRCQYFRSMFQEHWTENNQSLIQHDDFSYEVYKSFLKYLYTDEVDLPPENALELLYLANAYFEPQLKRRCVQIIKQGITVLNVAFLYSTAIEYNAQELEDFCFKFAMNHMTAVIQTPNFAKLDEATVKTFIIKAAQAGAFKT